MSFEARIQELGLTIPEPPKPAGHFVPAIQVGNLLFVSGQIPTVSGQMLMKGKLVSTPAYFWLILVFGEALGKVLGIICSSQAGSRPLGVV